MITMKAQEVLEFQLKSQKQRLAESADSLANDFRAFADRLTQTHKEGRALPSHIPVSVDSLIRLFRDFEATIATQEALQIVKDGDAE